MPLSNLPVFKQCCGTGPSSDQATGECQPRFSKKPAPTRHPVGSPIDYNTGIATYIWVLTNHKPEQRRGKVQLIDATPWFQPLRKNLGKKNCEFSAD
jgi:hypothetical protein